jgi:hypothetical protein
VPLGGVVHVGRGLAAGCAFPVGTWTGTTVVTFEATSRTSHVGILARRGLRPAPSAPDGDPGRVPPWSGGVEAKGALLLSPERSGERGRDAPAPAPRPASPRVRASGPRRCQACLEPQVSSICRDRTAPDFARRADFPYMLKAAFGRGRLRAGSLRSPVLAGQHQDDRARAEVSSNPRGAAKASPGSSASTGCQPTR